MEIEFEYDPLYIEVFQEYGYLTVEAQIKRVKDSFDHGFGTELVESLEIKKLKVYSGTKDITGDLKTHYPKEFNQITEAAEMQAEKVA